MIIKLEVSKKSDPQWCQEYEFDQDCISIGRDIKNDLSLKDDKTEVSRHHAQINVSEDSCKLNDLNSKNFTFLNDERINPNQSYNIKDGDKIKVGEYVIHFTEEKIEYDYSDKTIFSTEHPNPFIEDSKELASLLNRIREKYEQEIPGRKDEALHEALKDSLRDSKPGKVEEIIAREWQQDQSTPPQQLPQTSQADFTSNIPNLERTRAIFEILLKLFIKLNQARKQFKLEFVGETIIKSSQSFSLDSSSEENIRNYLFDVTIPREESDKRLELFKKASNEILYHQLALLEGYKTSANDGSKEFLNKMDPSIVNEKMANHKLILGPIKIPYRFLPFFGLKKMLKIYKTIYNNLLTEDQSFVEKSVFRPGFIRGYNKRMASKQNDTL